MMQRPRTSKGKAPGEGQLSDPESKGKGKGKSKPEWDRSPFAKKTWQSNWGKTASDGSQFCRRFHLYNTLRFGQWQAMWSETSGL